jgi:hypothetical protein
MFITISWCVSDYYYYFVMDVVLKHTKALNSTIHLVLDGWTAPIVVSFLGIVVVWFQEGVIYRAVLEFIRLVSKY